MKKLIILLIVLSILGAGAYYILLKKPEIILNDTVVTTAIDNFNKNNPNFKLSIKKENIEITADKGSGFTPRFRISIKNPELQYTLKALIGLLAIQDTNDIPDVSIVETAESINLVFEPTSLYLALRSVEGLTLSSTIPDKEVDDVTIVGKIASIKTSDINLSSFLKNKGSDAIKIYTGIMADNPSYNIIIKDAEVIVFPNKPKKNEEITKMAFTFKNIKLNADYAKELIKAIYDNSTQIDFTSFAKKGAKSNISSMSMEDFKLDINGTGNNKGGFTIGEISINTLLKPSPTLDDSLFISLKYNFEDITYTHLDPKDMEGLKAEKFAKFKELNLDFSVDKISPKLLELYVEVIQKIQHGMDNNPQIAQQVLLGSMEEFKQLFLANDPVIIFSLDPLDHELATANIKGKFEFSKATMFPLGEVDATIKDVPKIKQLLLKEKLMKPQEIERNFDMLEQYFENDGSGNYKLHFEIKKESPFFFLNEEPLK